MAWETPILKSQWLARSLQNLPLETFLQLQSLMFSFWMDFLSWDATGTLCDQARANEPQMCHFWEEALQITTVASCTSHLHKHPGSNSISLRQASFKRHFCYTHSPTGSRAPRCGTALLPPCGEATWIFRQQKVPASTDDRSNRLTDWAKRLGWWYHPEQ